MSDTNKPQWAPQCGTTFHADGTVSWYCGATHQWRRAKATARIPSLQAAIHAATINQ
jgi:hypothetical protein